MILICFHSRRTYPKSPRQMLEKPSQWGSESLLCWICPAPGGHICIAACSAASPLCPSLPRDRWHWNAQVFLIGWSTPVRVMCRTGKRWYGGWVFPVPKYSEGVFCSLLTWNSRVQHESSTISLNPYGVPGTKHTGMLEDCVVASFGQTCRYLECLYTCCEAAPTRCN